MDTIQKAEEVMRDSEAKIRDLISEAAAKQKYNDVKVLADLANRIAQLSPGNAIAEASSSYFGDVDPYELKELIGKSAKSAKTKKRNQPVAYSERPRKKPARRSSRPKPGYPKFVRDDDRLVKVGWSKKNKSEYEHRVPREAVLAFVRDLDEKVEEGEKFDIDGLFPVSDGSGGEVPGYQVYVVIAWLREADVIKKIGRDGYVVRDKSVLRGELDEQWNSLQPKSA